MIMRVIHWQNGNIMVFDESGQQMPEYQGQSNKELRRKIVAAASPDAIFEIGNWRTGIFRQTTRAYFAQGDFSDYIH